MPLSATAAAHAKPCKLWRERRLCLVVVPLGSLCWRCTYRHAGKRRTISLGIDPGVTLADATGQENCRNRCLRLNGCGMFSGALCAVLRQPFNRLLAAAGSRSGCLHPTHPADLHRAGQFRVPDRDRSAPSVRGHRPSDPRTAPRLWRHCRHNS